MPRHVSYDSYLLAVAVTLARRHGPVWSWRRWRRVCRCGAELPCRSRHRVPINRGHWPEEESPRSVPASSARSQRQRNAR
ncbi:hypothetical protein E1091_05675 [Micromonospora fluostatini]|uniref:Uncharacterized protein n=1 Tax=Micromonospora fluostatini TaxID=1629071 RepID=A0ABY2DP51_9ACTN|nr:hypothetical protein E1091_05675 [Micromonospora fluostatini]